MLNAMMPKVNDTFPGDALDGMLGNGSVGIEGLGKVV